MSQWAYLCMPAAVIGYIDQPIGADHLQQGDPQMVHNPLVGTPASPQLQLDLDHTPL